MLHITKITVSNYLGLTKLSLDKLGKLNMIRGENGAGKTSILRAITEAFQSSGSDINVINNQADDGKAEILIELNDGLKIDRLITEKNNRVIVKDGKGEPINKPQKYLDALLGPTAFNFNPMEFYNAKGKKRNELLLKAIDFRIRKQSFMAILRKHNIDLLLVEFDPDKIDFRCHGIELLDKVKAGVYEFRAIINIEVVRLTKALELDLRDMPAGSDKDWSAFNVTEKTQELLDAKDEISDNEATIKTITDEENDMSEKRDGIDRIDQEIQELKQQRAQLRNDIGIITDNLKILSDSVNNFKSPDIATIQSEINEYNNSQDFIFKQKEMANRQKTLNVTKIKHTALDSFYKKLDKEIPKQVLADADLPFDGLEFRDDDIFVDDVQIDKLSDSEVLTMGITIARQLTGDLKVICVNGWEQCDLKTIKKFEAQIEGDGFEYFITEAIRDIDGSLRVESEGVIDNAKN